MDGPFKFRYASELAGGFVLLTVFLLLAGIFYAGHGQGWFERRFELRTVFDTEEGSFGLKEGDEVRIRDTVAGSVGEIGPNAEGQMETTFIILNRFRPLVRSDSVARVKRVFGVAGDAYVEIGMGQGEMVRDGDWIECRKDEEIMETAQQFIGEFKEAVLPLLEDFRQLIARSNRIAGAIDEAEGLAGSMVRDQEMAADLKQTVRNMNDLLLHSQDTITEGRQLVTQIADNLEQQTGILGSVLNDEALVTDLKETVTGLSDLVREISDGLEEQKGLAGSMLYDRGLAEDVKGVVDDFSDLVLDAEVTINDLDRLVVGAQKHWLLRKYVPRTEEIDRFWPGQFRGREASFFIDTARLELDRARAMNDSPEIARSAVNLAALLIPGGDEEEIVALLHEAKAEYRAAGESDQMTWLLKAELDRHRGAPDDALALVTSRLTGMDRSDGDLLVCARLLLADIHADLGRTGEAAAVLDAIGDPRRRIDSPYLRARDVAIRGRLLALEGNFTAAAGELDRAANLLREAGSYLAMADALEQAGEAYAESGERFAAADRHFRAARTFHYGNEDDRARRALERALPLVAETGDEYMRLRVDRLREEIDRGLP